MCEDMRLTGVYRKEQKNLKIKFILIRSDLKLIKNPKYLGTSIRNRNKIFEEKRLIALIPKD
jgi:hypothetical protein